MYPVGTWLSSLPWGGCYYKIPDHPQLILRDQLMNLQNDTHMGLGASSQVSPLIAIPPPPPSSYVPF